MLFYDTNYKIATVPGTAISDDFEAKVIHLLIKKTRYIHIGMAI